ncbi:MAG: hypothetical protein WBV78_15870, partial [Roseobacter sp.]
PFGLVCGKRGCLQVLGYALGWKIRAILATLSLEICQNLIAATGNSLTEPLYPCSLRYGKLQP